jgi:hypothetical protein
MTGTGGGDGQNRSGCGWCGIGGRGSVAIVGPLHLDRGMIGTGGGDGQSLVLRLCGSLFFGDYPFDSSPASTGRYVIVVVLVFLCSGVYPDCAVFFHQGEISRQ